MPVPTRKQDGGSSSASGSGDSPISSSAKLPNTFFEGQSISSCHNDSTHSPDIEIGISIPEQSDGSGGPIQSVEPLDHQPPGYRGLLPASTSSERIYSMPEPEKYNELYTRNALETFRFGSASISTMTDTSSVDPLSFDDDFQPPVIDTTPRPSLAVHTEGARGQPLQMTSPSDRISTPNHRPMQNDATFRTFQSTSASPSGSPTVHPIDRSRFRSGASRGRSDDEHRVRGHKPSHVEPFSIDDESFLDDFHVLDNEKFSDVDFEITSSQFDHSGSFDIPPSEEGSFRESHLSQRRGSNPIPIPGAQAGPSQGRNRENSAATVKFPTPSAPSPSIIGPASLTNVARNPLSLPANGADWDQRRRTLQDRMDSPTSIRSHHAVEYPLTTGPSASTAGPSKAVLENVDSGLDFNSDEWQQFSLGKNLNDFRDVHAPTQATNNQSWWPFPPHDARRLSIPSTISDTFQKHPSAYKDQDWSFQRDKSDDGPIPKPKRNVFIPFSKRPPKRGPPWRGMSLGDVEYWRNELTGIYKLERTEVNASDTRLLQQHLVIYHSRDEGRQGSQSVPEKFRDRYNGPHTTVHKHSEVPAFSLSRHYRDKSHSISSDRQKSSKIQPLRNAVYINGTKTRMILLAPRKGQEQYTSTATTRKLESHGFLDDPYRKSDPNHFRRLADEDEKQRLKEQSKREKELEKKAKKDRGKVKIKGLETIPGTIETPPLATKSNNPFPPRIPANQDPCPGRGAIHDATSAADLTVPAIRYTKSFDSSVTVAIAPGTVLAQDSTLTAESLKHSSSSGTTSPPVPLPPEVSQPQSSTLQIQQSLSVSSGVTALFHHRRCEYNHGEEEDENDEAVKAIDPTFRRRKRTPHNEAYHSLSPESIDSFANQPDNHSRGLFSLISPKSPKRTFLGPDVPYVPPWLSAPSRSNNRSSQMQVVAGLKHSFQGVGVLFTEKMREISRRRAKEQAQDDNRTERRFTKEKDVFIDLSDEVLYMLVPLWPSETDPVSAKEHPFKMPELESAKRLYVVIYYKAWHDSAKMGKEKGRKRLSPSSFEGFYMDDRNVLMTQFYIGARVVTYDDLEGSNIRVPELGLSVMGPLQEAFDSAPVNKPRPKETNQPDKKGKGKERTETKSFWDFIIGTYYSRDHAIEFYPEGFKKMALATQEEVPTRNNASTSSLASVSSSTGGAASARSANTGRGAPADRQHPINSEEGLIQEAPIILTPMGRAVLEMAFMGAMAVTGFTPG